MNIDQRLVPVLVIFLQKKITCVVVKKIWDKENTYDGAGLDLLWSLQESNLPARMNPFGRGSGTSETLILSNAIRSLPDNGKKLLVKKLFVSRRVAADI